MADAHSSTCRKCGETKPVAAFSVVKKTGKPNPYCKVCRSALSREYAANHRDSKKAYNAEYRERNLDRLREYDRKRSKEPERRKALDRSIANWKAKFPEKVRAINLRNEAKRRGKRGGYWLSNKEWLAPRNRAWALSNPEKMRSYARKYQRQNPEIVRQSWRNRAARKRNAEGSHTAADIHRLLKLQRGCCAACFKPLHGKYHVDHRVALARGGSNDWMNLQLLHPRCNLRKHARDPVEYMQSEHGLLL